MRRGPLPSLQGARCAVGAVCSGLGLRGSAVRVSSQPGAHVLGAQLKHSMCHVLMGTVTLWGCMRRLERDPASQLQSLTELRTWSPAEIVVSVSACTRPATFFELHHQLTMIPVFWRS